MIWCVSCVFNKYFSSYQIRLFLNMEFISILVSDRRFWCGSKWMRLPNTKIVYNDAKQQQHRHNKSATE